MKVNKRVATIAATAILGLGMASLAIGPIVEAYSRGDKVKVIKSGPHYDWNDLYKLICGLSSGVETIDYGDGCTVTVRYTGCQPVSNGDGTWNCECSGRVEEASPGCEGRTGPIVF